MRRRYLAAWTPGSLPQPRMAVLEAMAAQSSDLAVVHRAPDLLVIADPGLPILSIAPDGLVIGTMVGSDARRPLDRIEPADAAAIVRSQGRMLSTRFWGSYLALLPGEAGGLDLIRSPFGDLGVCVTDDKLGWLIGSDAAILAAAKQDAPRLDLASFARHLAAPELVGAETCLTRIVDLRGGDRLVLRSGHTPVAETCWSPWAFAATAPESDVVEAATMLRVTTNTAVAASAAPYSRVLLFLSGGLDSSIVGRALSDAKQPFSALNLVTDDPIGDERDYARAAATALGIDLAEIDRDPAGIAFERSLAAPLPRPMARAFNQESERIALGEAARIGATALIDGSGGDNVFCSHRSVAATADCLLTSPFGQHYRATAHALADLTGAGLPRILIQSVRRAWFRRAGQRWVCDTRFLAPHFAALARERAPHPWLVAPRGVLPGSGLHVSLLAAAQALVESGSAPLACDRLSPLISQPVVEVCLRAPSWMWFAPGHDRALARRAFADRLPRLILDRRSKGTPAPFIAAVLADRRQEIRAFLLDGVLSGHGLLDGDALRRHFDNPAPVSAGQFARILGLIDAEAWARCWD